MAMVNRSVIVYLIMIIIVIALWGLTTGFALPNFNLKSTTTTTTTATTTAPPNKNTTTSTVVYVSPCQALQIINNSANASYSEECTWTGGTLGLWVASGSYAYESVLIKGMADGKVYVNQTSDYRCTSFWSNFTATNQSYLVTLKTGPLIIGGNANCTSAIARLNLTTTAPKSEVYSNVYNGNFSSGTYAGWTLTGKGFGTAPLNISAANSAGSGNTLQNANGITRCYLGSPWINYAGKYAATTYNCGTSVSPGNLTSSLFYAKEPFLNFKIISPQDNFLYITILYNNKQVIVAHYNTYNVSFTGNSSSTFRNATIPLSTVVGLPVRIEIVADTLNSQTYIAAGDFSLSGTPHMDKGINPQINFTNSTG